MANVEKRKLVEIAMDEIQGKVIAVAGAVAAKELGRAACFSAECITILTGAML